MFLLHPVSLSKLTVQQIFFLYPVSQFEVDVAGLYNTKGQVRVGTKLWPNPIRANTELSNTQERLFLFSNGSTACIGDIAHTWTCTWTCLLKNFQVMRKIFIITHWGVRRAIWPSVSYEAKTSLYFYLQLYIQRKRTDCVEMYENVISDDIQVVKSQVICSLIWVFLSLLSLIWIIEKWIL